MVGDLFTLACTVSSLHSFYCHFSGRSRQERSKNHPVFLNFVYNRSEKPDACFHVSGFFCAEK